MKLILESMDVACRMFHFDGSLSTAVAKTRRLAKRYNAPFVIVEPSTGDSHVSVTPHDVELLTEYAKAEVAT